MDKYAYLFLGVVLGILIVAYLWISREEKIERKIKTEQKKFSTEKLNNTMENVVHRIEQKIEDLKRELTEDEKNEIIVQCYKEKFDL